MEDFENTSQEREELQLSQMYESLLDAIDILASKKIESLPYNKMIVCSIVDVSEAADGKYLVTDGATQFYAYSENTEYEKDISVYVNIPNGQWEEQKQIVGRYIKDQQKSITYVSPFSKFIDMTNNLLPSPSSFGLIANHPEIQVLQVCNLTKENNRNLFETLRSYDFLGIKGVFKTDLKRFNTVSGTYGLMICIQTTKNGKTVENNDGEEKVYNYTYDMNNKKMYGDTYNFLPGSLQETIVNLKEVEGEIKSIDMYFYQKQDFRNSDKELIPYGVTFSTSTDGKKSVSPYGDNIILSDLYLCAGYDISNFENDKLILYTLNGNTYDSILDSSIVDSGITLEDFNKKIINFRFLQKTDDGIKVITEKDVDKAFFHLYQRDLNSAGLKDNLAGEYWFEINLDANSEEFYLEYPPTNFFTENSIYEFQPDTHKKEYEFKAILEINSDLYESEILTISNTSEVLDEITADLLRNLSIQIKDSDDQGIYNIYNYKGAIISESESSRTRILEADFSTTYVDNEVYDKITKITWSIPKENTMIQAPAASIRTTDDNDPLYWKVIETDKKISEVEKETLIKGTSFNYKNYLTLDYKIKPFYNQNYNNNTIKCEIEKGGRVYSSEITLFFGYSGANGTDYILTLQFANDEDAFNINGSGVTVVPNLIDADGQVVDLTHRDITVSYKFVEDKGREKNPLTTTVNDDKTCLISKKTGTWSPSDYAGYILKAEVSGVASVGEGSDKTSVTIDAYLPISIKTDSKKYSFKGPTKVIYGTTGNNPAYYNGYIQVLDDNREKLAYDWSVVIKDGQAVDAASFYPSVLSNGTSGDKDYYMVSTPIYYTGNSIVSLVGKESGQIKWIQPVYIAMERNSNVILNNWSGKLTQDENNDIILSSMIGAGKKETDNSFSGVLMGEIKGDNNVGKIGLYGYQGGGQSFSIDVDGRVTIGKSGSGQLVFEAVKDESNGKTRYVGTITSSNYLTNGHIGMFLNLTDGILISNNSQGTVTIDPSDTNTPIFKIEGKNNDKLHTLLSVGGSEGFIIQSMDEKTKINLSDSNFLLNAGPITINSNPPPNKEDVYFINFNNVFKINSKNKTTIGAWEVTENYLKSGNLWLYGENTAMSQTLFGQVREGLKIFIGTTNNSFAVDNNGIMYCKGAYISDAKVQDLQVETTPGSGSWYRVVPTIITPVIQSKDSETSGDAITSIVGESSRTANKGASVACGETEFISGLTVDADGKITRIGVSSFKTTKKKFLTSSTTTPQTAEYLVFAPVRT